MYPEKLIYDVAALPAVRGRDLVDGLIEQAARYEPSYRLGATAEKLERQPDGRLLITDENGDTILARAVIITAGIGSFAPRPLPAGRAHEGRGLVYFVPVLADLAGKDVVIVGGGDSAFDWAQSLHPLARSVTLVHRRAAFRAHAATVTAVREAQVEIVTDAQVTEIHGEHGIEYVTLEMVKTKEQRQHTCQVVVAALGFTADLGPLESWGLAIVDRHICVDSTMATGVPGVFAAGDVTEYQGKVRLMSVGFGEAATAVNNAAILLDPGAELFPGHSSEL
jgi:thioredoxin reductase (NADPH)